MTAIYTVTAAAMMVFTTAALAGLTASGDFTSAGLCRVFPGVYLPAVLVGLVAVARGYVTRRTRER